MKKSCYICKYSVAVKYTRIMCNKQKYKKEELFCISAPPGVKNKFIWGSVGKGYRELIKHRGYPIVSNVAPCSLYILTDDKKKIEKYNIKIKEMKIQKKQEIEDKKKEKIQEKIKLEKAKVLKEEIKKEKIREEKKRKQKKA